MNFKKNIFFGICINLCFISVYASTKIIIKYQPQLQDEIMLKNNEITQEQLLKKMMQPLSSEKISYIESIANVKAQEIVAVGNGAHVIELNGNFNDAQINTIFKKLHNDYTIDYVEKSEMMHAFSTPNFNDLQWDMKITGDNFENMYLDPIYANNTKPGQGIVVAVIDTGYTPHVNYYNSDLADLMLVKHTGGSCISKNGFNSKCYGYQFISDCRISRDYPCNQSYPVINYRADGLDLGDYDYYNNSSWHGSHVTGTIIAQGYDYTLDANSILGGSYGAKVLPIRTLGFGGGSDYDIANAILWAANRYPLIPNENQAQVINMSLGGISKCSRTTQDAINQAVNAGVIVVVAAGNDAIDVAKTSPANCKNVISVSAKDGLNSLAYYSNYGKTTITASGGGANGTILSTIWGSSYDYIFNEQASYASYQGTSMAAPHVSASVAAILSYLKEQSISYTLNDIIKILQESAKSLDNKCNTTSSSKCVSGLTLDAKAALDNAIHKFNNNHQ